MMASELTYKGETLTLATAEEMRTAILLGQHISRIDGISRYRYRGRDYLIADRDLKEERT